MALVIGLIAALLACGAMRSWITGGLFGAFIAMPVAVGGGIFAVYEQANMHPNELVVLTVAALGFVVALAPAILRDHWMPGA